MIAMDELLKGVKLESQPADVQANLKTLLERINVIRQAWNKAMTVTSGLRTREDQVRIYTAKGIPESKIPWGSMHLTGGAVDIFDPNKELQQWCKANEDQLVKAQLWMEDFSATPNWAHFQITPPKSGKRWFMP